MAHQTGDVGHLAAHDVLENAFRVPSYVPATYQRPFDPGRSLFNFKSSNTRRQRASLARSTNGVLEHHLILGDSESDNYCGDSAYGRTRMWPRRMRDQLCLLTGAPSGGEGIIRAGYAGGSDPRWTLGSWVNNTGYVSSTTNGQVATCVTSEACVSIDFYYLDSTGSFSVTVDGAQAKTASTAGTYLVKRLQWTGLSNATHTVAVTNTAATNTGSYFLGIGAYNLSGIVVHNIAYYGGTTDLYSNAANANSFQGLYLPLSLFGGTQPGGATYTALLGSTYSVHYQMGVNDLNNSVAIATITNNITLTRNAFPNADFNLHFQQQPAGQTAANWQTFAAAYYALADTLDVPLLDWFDRTKGSTLASADGMLSADNLHPTQAWQYAQGRATAQMVAA